MKPTVSKRLHIVDEADGVPLEVWKALDKFPISKESGTRKVFVPDNPDGSFTQGAWKRYWNCLSISERQSLRDKAAWEHMSLSAVAMKWGAADN